METVKEFKEANDDVKFIFDGAGTKWIPELSKIDHKYNKLYEAVKDNISGSCSYCATAYGVKEEVKACGISLLDKYEGHPSFKEMVYDGYQIITF